MDRGAEWVTLHRAAQSRTRLKRLSTHTGRRFYTRWLPPQPEMEMATHFSTLPWKIPCMEEPGRLQPMGLQRVRHD